MKEKIFWDELKSAMHCSELVVEKIKSHNLPVVIFGAAELAKQVTEWLDHYDVKIFGYAVDEKYFTPNQTYLGLPIFNFDELSQTPEKYIFVLGIGTKLGKRRSSFLEDANITKYSVTSNEMVCFYKDYIMENQKKFIETFDLLADDFSKKTLLTYLKANFTNDVSEIISITQNDEYFNDLTRPVLSRGEAIGYVDCGAFDGDTVEDFINFSEGKYGKVFAFEADPKNFEKLKNFVREKNYKNVELLNCGVWSEKTTLFFYDIGSGGSRISEFGNSKLEVDSIDNIVGEEKIDFIKMDIEGSELNALKGAIKTLERCKPVLAISIYHKKEDLITIPQFLKKIYPNAKFYLRKYNTNAYFADLNLYVIPK